MRIVSLNRDPGISPDRHKGAAIHLAAMRDAFSRLGHEVVSIDEPRDDYVLASLERLQESSGIDLVYERYALASAQCARWLRRQGIRHVVEVNSPLEDEVSRYRDSSAVGGWRREDAEVFGGAAEVVAVSPDTARYAIDRGACVRRTVVLPNGIDERIFHSRARPVPENRVFGGKRFPKAILLGFHGRLRPWHNFEAFVELACSLLANGVDVHVVAAGKGHFEELLGARLPTSAYSVFPWVPQAELGRLVRCFDILPLTYSPDAPCYFSPLKLNEAMACGVVPVVPRLGNLGDVVEDGANGLVYTSDPAGHGLNEAVRRLADDESMRQRMSVNAALSGSGQTWLGIAKTVLARLETQS